MWGFKGEKPIIPFLERSAVFLSIARRELGSITRRQIHRIATIGKQVVLFGQMLDEMLCTIAAPMQAVDFPSMIIFLHGTMVM